MTMLYEQRYSRQEIIDLFRFIDWVLTLPAELEEAFRNDLATFDLAKWFEHSAVF
jgi:hypothetical protein